MFRLAALVAALSITLTAQTADPGAPVPPPDVPADEVIHLWPGEPPNEPSGIGPEVMLVERRRPFYQITNVTEPTVSVYLPSADKATGAAILVLPGGGLQRLAIEHEGYEVAEWLTEQGIAAFVVKYRVPARTNDREMRYQAGLQDAQRAMRIVKSRAAAFGIDPDGIGAIGFSAGGELGTWLALRGDESHYSPLDNADKTSATPAFLINVYPGGLLAGPRDGDRPLRETIASRINAQTPPMFVVHAFPDDSLNSLRLVTALKEANVPAELHLFQQGAHGFGLRGSGAPFAQWSDLALNWMEALGFLDSLDLREYSQQFGDALAKPGAKLPMLSTLSGDVGWEEAYRSQKRIVREHLSGEEIIGFKGAASSPGAQENMGIDRPFHCAIFASGAHEAASTNSLPAQKGGVVETELGYILGVDIATEIENADEARTATQAVVPLLELPVDFAKVATGTPTATDNPASNCGGRNRILRGDEHHPDEIDLDALPITLSQDGKQLHALTGAATKGGQWDNLKVLINQIVSTGRILREGDIVLSGAIGAPQPAPAGRYHADFGELGEIEIQLTR